MAVGGVKHALDSRIDSLSPSRRVSTLCSSTKSRSDLGSSSAGRNAASTIVDLSMSIVDSSLELALSKVLSTLCPKSAQLYSSDVAFAYLEILLAVFIYIANTASDLPQYLDLLGDSLSQKSCPGR